MFDQNDGHERNAKKPYPDNSPGPRNNCRYDVFRQKKKESEQDD
jgi:hypothetical protein